MSRTHVCSPQTWESFPLAGLRAPSVCACNLCRPEMTSSGSGMFSGLLSGTKEKVVWLKRVCFRLKPLSSVSESHAKPSSVGLCRSGRDLFRTGKLSVMLTKFICWTRGPLWKLNPMSASEGTPPSWQGSGHTYSRLEKWDAIFNYPIIYRYVGCIHYYLLAVQNAKWQGANVFGSCLRHTLQREGTFCPSTGTNDRAPQVILQGP